MKTRQGYITAGPVRGECGHVHRTLQGALRCLERDVRHCSDQGGFSDRSLRRSDGAWLTDDEMDRVRDIEDGATK